MKIELERPREHVKLFLRRGVVNMPEDMLYENMEWRELETHCSKRLKLFLDHKDSENKNIQDDLEEKSDLPEELILSSKKMMSVQMKSLEGCV